MGGADGRINWGKPGWRKPSYEAQKLVDPRSKDPQERSDFGSAFTVTEVASEAEV